MQNTLFIPKKIKVGFQTRQDTFTGKLAYVIYFDEKGVLRKETSWKSWCDPKIEAIEIENSPRAGYIFNKGQQRYSHWGSGRSVIRVYDPRDFEFEISVDNLIGLLMHSDVSKRDIMEECVFAWAGKELVLLPVNSEEYQKSVAYTKKQDQKVSSKELVKGYTYNQKKSEDALMYLGYFEWFDWRTNQHNQKEFKSNGKKHVFYSEKSKSFSTPAVASFSSVNSSEVSSNYSNIVDKFYTTINSQPVVSVKVAPFTKLPNYGYIQRKIEDNLFEAMYISHHSSNHGELFRNIDYQIYRTHFVFTGQSFTEETIHNNHRYNNYYNRTPGPIEAKFKETAKELGYNPDSLSFSEFKDVLKKENFGIIHYVREDGSAINSNSNTY